MLKDVQGPCGDLRIYLAGHFPRKEQLAKYRRQLENVGATVTSRWVLGGEEGKTWPEIAEVDLNDIRRANMVVVFTGPYTLDSGELIPGGHGIGHWVEFGLAYGLKKELHVIGPTESPLLLFPGVRHWVDWEAFYDWVKGA